MPGRQKEVLREDSLFDVLGLGEAQFLQDFSKEFENVELAQRYVGTCKDDRQRIVLLSGFKADIKQGKWGEDHQGCFDIARVCVWIMTSPSVAKLRQSATNILKLIKEHSTVFDDPQWKDFVVNYLSKRVCTQQIDSVYQYGFAGFQLKQLLAFEGLDDILKPNDMILTTIFVALEKVGDLVMTKNSHNESASDRKRNMMMMEWLSSALLCYLACDGTQESLISRKDSMTTYVANLARWLSHNRDLGEEISFKALRLHVIVAAIRFNNLYYGYDQSSSVEIDPSLIAQLHQSVLPILMWREEGDDGQQEVFLAPLIRHLGFAEIRCILLRNMLAYLPAEVLFPKINGVQIAQRIYETLRSFTEEKWFDVSLQQNCLCGLSEWCKLVQQGLHNRPDLMYPFWKELAQSACLDLVEYVLDNWGHGARKARYHLEPLIRGALAALDTVRWELRDSFPSTDVKSLDDAHDHLIRTLLHQIVIYDPENERSNLKASIPLLLEVLAREPGNALKWLALEPKCVHGILQCFSMRAHVAPLASRLFVAIACDLEPRPEEEGPSSLQQLQQERRKIWIQPMVHVIVTNEHPEMTNEITRVLLPDLMKEMSFLTSDVLLSSLGKDGMEAGISEKITIWISLVNAGAQMVILGEGEERPTKKDKNEDEGIGGGSKKQKFFVAAGDLRIGLLHQDKLVVLKAAGLLFCRPKKRSPIGKPRLALCKEFIPTITKWVGSAWRDLETHMASFLSWLKQGIATSCEKEDVVLFLKWLQYHLLECLHPTGPMERLTHCLELLKLVLDTFSGDNQVIVVNESKDIILSLIHLLTNTYQRVRTLTMEVLLWVDAPYAGFETKADVHDMIQWGVRLLSGTRLREVDGGGVLLRVVFSKYVCQLGWALDIQDFETDEATLHPLTNERIQAQVGEKIDEGFMHIACEEANRCERSEKAYCVGAVVIDSEQGSILAKGFSRELPGNTHAEETAFMKLGGQSSYHAGHDDVANGNARGTTIYSTMEPCSVRLSGNRPCTSRCIAAGVRRVVIGVREPSKFVTCTGTQELIDAGINVDYIKDDVVRKRCMEPNMFLFPDETVEPFQNVNNVDFMLQALGQNLPRELAMLHYLWQLCNLIRRRYMTESDHYHSLCGLIRATRFCWEDALGKMNSLMMDEWRELAEELLKVVITCLDAASKMVGAAAPRYENGPDDEEVFGEQAGEYLVHVDCRGHPMLHMGQAGPVQGLYKDTNMSRLVINSWSLIRDGSEFLQAFVTVSPLQYDVKDSGTWILSYEQVKRSGEWLLHALRVLKHMGAIENAIASFQGICSRLLRCKQHGEEDGPSLFDLPSTWLDFLLERLMNNDQGFFLRRSSGFAGSFLAIARSEPRTCKATILRRMISNLIDFTKEPHALAVRVHSLNTIRVLIQDGSLASSLEQELPEVLELSIDGFKSPAWNIRNSSMIVFSSITKRVFGVTHQGMENSVGHRMTASFFFTRFANLEKRLLADLKAGQDDYQHIGPTLYPCLLLLSRLEPNYLLGSASVFLASSKWYKEWKGQVDVQELEQGWKEANECVMQFVPLLLRCCGHVHAMVRLMSARALGSIIPNYFIIKVLREEILPALLDEKSTNMQHGLLLQIQYLVQAIRERNLFANLFQQESSVDDVILTKIVHDLELALTRSLVATIERSLRKGCQMVYNCCWDVLKQWLSLRDKHCSSIPYHQTFLENMVRNDKLISDDLSSLWAVETISRYFPERGAEFLMRFEHNIQVRGAALQALERYLECKPLSDSLLSELAELIGSLFFLEEQYCYPPELISRLRVFSKCCRFLEKESLVDIFTLFEMSFESAVTNGERVHAGYLICLCALFPHIECSQERMVNLSKFLLMGAQYNFSSDVRSQVLEGLKISTILGRADCPMDAWLALLSLLQDENDRLRETAVNLGNQYLVTKNSMEPQCEPILLKKCFAKIVDKYNGTNEWSTYCDQSILKHEKKFRGTVQTFIRDGITDLGLSKAPLFEAEKDNVYVEPLIIETLIAQNAPTHTNNCFKDQTLLQTIKHIQTQTAWPGGLAFHPDLYDDLYSLVLRSDRVSKRDLMMILSDHSVGDHAIPFALKQVFQSNEDHHTNTNSNNVHHGTSSTENATSTTTTWF